MATATVTKLPHPVFHITAAALAAGASAAANLGDWRYVVRHGDTYRAAVAQDGTIREFGPAEGFIQAIERAANA